MIHRFDNAEATVTVMGFDHMPYSSNPSGAPDEIVAAVKAGFGKNIDDFDCRDVEWIEPTFKLRVKHAHK
jgi:hypothetical protein